MALLDTITSHRAEILAIAARHGVEDIRIFGSVL
jgi:predicted nucleotidyltransferase